MGSRTIYRPSVCRQTADAHVHYDVVLTKRPHPDSSNEDLIKKLANKVGGQTPGQVIEALLAKRPYLDQYGIEYIKIEEIPTYQICHKGEDESPALDWDAPLYNPPVIYPPVPPANPQVGRIRHRR